MVTLEVARVEPGEAGYVIEAAVGADDAFEPVFQHYGGVDRVAGLEVGVCGQDRERSFESRPGHTDWVREDDEGVPYSADPTLGGMNPVEMVEQLLQDLNVDSPAYAADANPVEYVSARFTINLAGSESVDEDVRVNESQCRE